MVLGRDVDESDLAKAVIAGLAGFESRVAEAVKEGLAGVDKQIAAAVVEAIDIHREKCGEAILARLADIRERVRAVETRLGMPPQISPSEKDGATKTILNKIGGSLGDVLGKIATVLILTIVITVMGWINHAQTAAVASKTQEAENVAKANEKALKDIKGIVDMMLWGQ